MEGRPTPSRRIDPGPAPGFDPAPSSNGVGCPAYGDDARPPDPAIVGVFLPDTGLVKICKSLYFRIDVRRTGYSVEAGTAGGRPNIHFVLGRFRHGNDAGKRALAFNRPASRGLQRDLLAPGLNDQPTGAGANAGRPTDGDVDPRHRLRGERDGPGRDQHLDWRQGLSGRAGAAVSSRDHQGPLVQPELSRCLAQPDEIEIGLAPKPKVEPGCGLEFGATARSNGQPIAGDQSLIDLARGPFRVATAQRRNFALRPAEPGHRGPILLGPRQRWLQADLRQRGQRQGLHRRSTAAAKRETPATKLRWHR